MSALLDNEWVTFSAMVRLGKSVQELAAETVEEILGFDPLSYNNYLPNEEDLKPGAKGGHKPARPDIQKMQDVYRLYLDKQLQPGEERSTLSPGAAAAREWDEKYAWKPIGIGAPTEEGLIKFYQQEMRNYRGDAQKSFNALALMMDAVANREGESEEVGKGQTIRQPTPEGKKAAGALLKKYEERHYAQLYEGIVRALRDLEREHPESYKLWPWAVKQMKADFQNRLQYGGISEVGRGSLRFDHMVDIVGEGGSLLNRLRAENRVPQNLDVNRLDFQEFEQWLMQWKRDNREAEAQGEIVYEFKDGWTIQKLTTPEQLQFEGDEMGHCLLPSALVGYTPVPDVEDGTVALGETVYHARALPYTGRALRISTAGTLPIEVTPEHQFLVVRPQKTTPLQDRYFKNRMPDDLEPQWLRASEIEVGDYLLSPVPDLTPEPLPSDLAWMYGVYVGDGGTNGSSKADAPMSGIQFTLGPDDDLDRLVETLTNEGYRPKVTDRGTYRRVRVNSRKLAEQFVEWFGSGSESKRMPDWLLGHPAALEGLLSADGHFKESEQSWTFTSTSRVLAQQVWLAARVQGFYPSITTYKRKEGNGYPNAKPSWKVRWQINNRRWAQNRQWREWYVTPVKAIDPFHYEGDVYSPETVSHTYLVNGVICHNCVGSYSDSVGRGQDIIYSLRDPKGMPHVTIEVKALEGPPHNGYDWDDGGPEDASYNHEYIHPDRHAPGDHMEEGVSSREPPYRPTGETPFQIVQIMGNSNKTPKPEYQRKIREFLDHLRAKGWKFVRSDEWFAPFDDPSQGQYGDGAPASARQLDEWYDDHYKTHHEQYRGIGDGDAYGLPAERATIGIDDWEELFKDIFRSLVYEYDPGRWRGNWRDLAQAVYHAWMIDIYKDRLDPEALEKHKQNLVDEIQSAEQILHEWNDDNWMYAQEHVQDEIAEGIKEEAEKRGELPKIEQALNEEYGEDMWDDSELVEWVRDNDEDLYYAGTDKARDEATDYFAGDAYKFVNYVIQLAEKYGGLNPQDLPDPNERHGGLPSYEELQEMPWPSQQQQETPVEKGLPGALSSAPNDIQIYPIDHEHNIWFDEDGNQHERWRPGWAKDPATGKMVQTGELEDTFLDRQGRQGEGWVAYHGDNPIGSLTYVADPAGWNMLGTAFVHPDYREQGLFNRMVAPLRESGKPIDAYVWNNPWLKQKVRSWGMKTASAPMYHVAPADLRERIMKEGLRAQPVSDRWGPDVKNQPAGLYAFNDPVEARRYRDVYGGDIWSVDGDGAQPDPGGNFVGSFYLPTDRPASLFARHEDLDGKCWQCGENPKGTSGNGSPMSICNDCLGWHPA